MLIYAARKATKLEDCVGRQGLRHVDVTVHTPLMTTASRKVGNIQAMLYNGNECAFCGPGTLHILWILGGREVGTREIGDQVTVVNAPP